jgi:siroheme synthase
MSGKAYLVGAGPGRADLITVRGLQLIRQAEVIIYDRLIAPELLDEASPDAELIFVGKESGHHIKPQDEVAKKHWRWPSTDFILRSFRGSPRRSRSRHLPGYRSHTGVFRLPLRW